MTLQINRFGSGYWRCRALFGSTVGCWNSGLRMHAGPQTDNLEDLDGLVTTGKASTIGKLMDKYDLFATISRKQRRECRFGTCAV